MINRVEKGTKERLFYGSDRQLYFNSFILGGLG